MSSNTDNQMTRFLFAILKQKNLKDIDWNAVAHDPILSQPITNGHAARMRYSRFRSAMLGLEPQKRNRATANKNRVTKNKKEQKPPKKEEEEEDEKRVKPEPGTLEALHQAEARARSPVKVKHEHSQPSYRQQFTPTSMASPTATECQQTFHPRMLTPCSDDMFSAPHNLQFSPSASLMGAHPTFDLPSAMACAHEPEQQHHHEHDHNSWAPSPIYSAFDAAYDIDGFGVGSLCDHQAGQGHTTDDMHGSPVLGSLMPEHMNIKNEHWDTHFHP
ncbi:hypothetical protein CABS01_06941 [Colletotrichum abscissum]|uniref:Myb-like DNA-binding domain-containing protein n=2 Tax=Colletotrichum acutatum species complex TaxID=2707335 RepID=A0A9P9XKE0_9PEZI|nr:uncharacterized protein CABS01_06941 [Colletotrichum abscissum]KAI3552521.1 hypothetical protein CSPX01_00270 [Colletotrichum filicis]KAI3555503.1 hypothetical protein CABS02_04259 [Colletotrichum abscissum]KAK0378453.1 hypothetical protein CLIM01_04156 [Colletotrichum limetticola]KAK1514962.1 hypothetical protein CABS01_06941 [Colletotrichum abscissum]